MPGGSEIAFLESLDSVHVPSPLLSLRPTHFTIVHYAGTVDYLVEGFLEKNGDKFLEDQRTTMLGSESELIRALFDDAVLDQRKRAQTAGASSKTIASRFCKQLDDLITQLSASKPHFIRCIKPNSQKKPAIFEPSLCLQQKPQQHWPAHVLSSILTSHWLVPFQVSLPKHGGGSIGRNEAHEMIAATREIERMRSTVSSQLQYSGIFEITAITRSGFPFRCSHQAFVARYGCIVPSINFQSQSQQVIWRDAASKLLNALPRELSQDMRMRLGRTMVLWRVKEHEQLELLRNVAVETSVVQVQASARRQLARRARVVATRARQACEQAVARRDVEMLQEAIEMAKKLPVSFAWARSAQLMMNRLALEARVKGTLESLVGRNPEETHERLRACVAEAEELGNEFATFYETLLSRAHAQLHVVSQQRDARDLLKQIIDKDSLRRGLKMAADSNLFDGVDAMSARRTEDMDLILIAQTALSRMDEEELKLDVLRDALFITGVLRWDDAHQPILSACSADILNAALTDCISFGTRTQEGVFLQEAGRVSLKLRQLVLAAGDGAWSVEQREAIENVLQSSVPLHAKVPELQEAARRVASRAKVQDVVTLLEQSIAVLHHEALKMALMQAEAAGKESLRPYAALYSTAQALDLKLDQIRSGLRKGIKEVSLDDLRPALKSAATIGLTHYEQPTASMLALQIERILTRARAALKELETADMHAILAEAQSLNLCTAEIDQIRTLVEMTPEKLLVEQLKVAVRLGQEDRQDELQMEIKKLFFARSGNMFALQSFPKLRSAEEWASAKRIAGKTRKELRDLFLQFQSEPIPTSLTQLDKIHRENATHIFRCIQGYMGDAGFCYPLVVVKEMIGLALKGGGPLQTEAYVQLMKQLTGNPNAKSVRLGWQLFALMLQSFPPDPALENFVVNFLRVRSPEADSFLKLSCASARCGPRHRVPDEQELLELLQALEVRPDEKNKSRGVTAMLPPPTPRNCSTSIKEGQAVSGKL